MKIQLKIIVMAMLFLVATSVIASNLIEPNNATDSLLTGQMTFAPMPLIGTPRCIKITFINNDTQKEYQAIPDKKGFFSILNPESGNYTISNIEQKNDYSKGNWDAEWPLPQIQVEPEKVISLGSLKAVFRQDPKIENRYNHVIIQDCSLEEFKDLFTKQFPKSAWLQRDWVNILLDTQTIN